MNKTDIERIRLCCRRGMWELDLLLEGFLDHVFKNLPETKQQAFLKLLDCDDTEIFAWLMATETPNQAELKDIVALIQQHAPSYLRA